MAVIEEDGFAKLLKSEMTDNVFFIFGNDSYLKNFMCKKLVSLCVDDTLKFFNFHTYDKDSTLETIFADAENLPVMSERTCLLINDWPLTELGTKQLAAFGDSLMNIPETTVMIFYYKELEVSYSAKKSSKWNGVISVFEKAGKVVRLDHRTTAKICAMLMKSAKDRGTSIDKEEANYLISCVGEDMQTLLNEFNKVCSFSCGEKITKEMIDATVVKSVEASVFDISSAIFSGDTDRAFEILGELLRLKTPPQSIIGALSSAYVNIYRYKVAVNSDHTVADFAAAYGYTGGYDYTFKKISAFTKKISISSVRKALDILSDADIRSKSTKYDAASLLTELISRLAAIS